MAAPYDLDRFIEAQTTTFDQALQELAAGRKRSHWMWFVFPQCFGLGASDMARRYAIGGLEEAHAYLQHPVLGNRLRACTATVNAVSGRTAHDIFGSPDDMKFRSSMTLFSRADPSLPEFGEALTAYFNGEEDARTIEILSRG